MHGGIDCTFGIERIEDGLDEDSVYPTLHERVDLFHIIVPQLVVGQFARSRIGDIGRNRERLVCRPHGSRHKAWPGLRGELISSLTGKTRSGKRHLAGYTLKMIIGLRDALRRERVGLDDIGSGLEITPMDIEQHIRTCEVQHVVVAFQLPRGILEPVAAEVGFAQPPLLNDSAQCSVKNYYSLFYDILQFLHHLLLFIG